MSYTAIWEASGVRMSRTTLYRRLREAGVPPGCVRNDHAAWLRRWREGESLAAIARDAGVTRQAVHAALRELALRHGA